MHNDCLTDSLSTSGYQGCGGQYNCANYNPLIQVLAPFSFKAMLWYQGESNVGCNHNQSHLGYYARLLPALIDSWRLLFQSPFTAVIVMLAPQGETDETSKQRDADAYPALQQSQLAVLKLANIGMIYPIDLGDDGKTVYTPPSPRHGDIHPRNKTEFGRRLALVYGAMEGFLPETHANGCCLCVCVCVFVRFFSFMSIPTSHVTARSFALQYFLGERK